MMILRILLGVACLSLLNTSQAEAQLFRRLYVQPQPQYRAQPQPQYRAQPQPQYRVQPQRYAPQATNPQNGYQGRLTATPRSRAVYLRRADGSVVQSFPNNIQRPAAQVQNPSQAQPLAGQRRVVGVVNGQVQGNATTRPNIVPNRVVTTQGQLIPRRPTVQQQPQLGSVYRSPVVQPSPIVQSSPVVQPMPAVAPVGVSALNQTKGDTTIGSIAPATAMPEAVMSRPASASSIPVNAAATNPAPTGLSLSSPNDVSSASASVDVEIQPTPSASEVLDSAEPKSFSVLETIE